MNGNSIHASEAYMFMQIPKHFHLPGLSIKKKSYIFMSRYTHLSSSLHDVILEQYLLNYSKTELFNTLH